MVSNSKKELFQKIINLIPKEQIDNTIENNSDIWCEMSFEPSDPFIGFMEYYDAISKIIPYNYTIIDIGCAYAFQSYLFKDHKQYIGICPSCNVKILPQNGIFYKTDANNFITNELPKLNLNLDKVFCICSYVPLNKHDQNILKNTFKNLFYYYPSFDNNENNMNYYDKH